MATDFLTPIQVGAGIVARGQQMRAQKQQMEQANALFPLQMAEAQMGLQSKALEIQSSFLNRQIMLKNQQGAMELGNLLASSNFDDPMLRPKVMGLISRYPHIAQTKEFQYALEGFKIAEKAASDMEIAKTRANATIESARIRAAASGGSDASGNILAPEEVKLPSGTTVIWQKGTRKWVAVKPNGDEAVLDKDDLIELSTKTQNEELRALADAELMRKFGVQPKKSKPWYQFWGGDETQNKSATKPIATPVPTTGTIGRPPVSAAPPSLKGTNFVWTPEKGLQRK